MSLLYRQVLRWISRLTPSATRCAWATVSRAPASAVLPSSSVAPGGLASGTCRVTSSSCRLAKNTELPGSPCRPARPRSWWSSRLLPCRPAPITCSPPSAAIWPWSPATPPSRMSVPRPAIWVETVMAARVPASATIAASSASFLALSTMQLRPARRRGARRSARTRPRPGCRSGRGVRWRARRRRGRRVPFPSAWRGEQPVRLVDAHARPVGRDHGDLQPVELAELLADGHGGAGHAAHRGVPADQRLDRDAVEDLAGLAGGQAFLRLDGRVQPVGPALQPGDPAAGCVDEVYLAVP